MIKNLAILSCSFISSELSHVISNGDYPDVKLYTFPANCAQNGITQKSVFNIFKKLDPNKTDVVIIGNTCISDEVISNIGFNITYLPLEQCFEVFLNREMVLHYISKGNYIVTNGWLQQYNVHIKNWGFTDSQSKNFFGESMKGIILLNTFLDDKYQENLEKLSDYMGLPYEVIPVGLTSCSRFIDGLIYNWRYKVQNVGLSNRMASLSRKSADYSTIFSQLERLVDITDERLIVDVCFALLNLLYSPGGLSYKKISEDEIEIIEFIGVRTASSPKSNEGFKIEVIFNSKLLGEFDISDIQFPEYIDEYKKTGQILSHVFSISIANARKYEIMDAQKNELEHYLLELEKTNATKDKFFSILSHDLRNPLGTALNLSEVLKSKAEDADNNEILKLSLMVNSSISSTFNLMSNLLDWSRTQTNKIVVEPEEIRLSELVDDEISMLKNQADSKNIVVKSELSDKLTVMADLNMLRTVVRNLISNSIKYCNKTGSIIVSSEITSRFVQISVKDNGIGMESDKVKQLFKIEKANSTPGTNKEKGTGLGLILCKEFVEKHNGTIWAESKVGVGSTFYFTIPV